MNRFSIFLITVFLALPLAAKPDLTIANAKSTPSGVGVTSDFVFTFDLKNIGDLPVASPAVKVPMPAGATFVGSNSSNVVCVMYTGGAVCTGVSGWSLNAGATTLVSLTWRAPAAPGTFSSVLEADPDQKVDEASETNNKATISGSYFDSPRVAAKLAYCASAVAVNSIGGSSFVLKNVGTVDVRYPGLKIQVTAAQPVIVTHTDPRGGTVSGVTYGTAATSHTFWYTPPASYIPLRGGATAPPLFVYVKSPTAQKVQVRASIDTQAIQDTTPADNVADCVISVQ